MPRVRLEFTVEPFADGHPGPHVRAAIEAVEATGLAVDVGPFSTLAEADADAIRRAVDGLLSSAFAAGASRISFQITAVGEAA
jgi:uncharacterized protein YqgV (UPF0045/DUF77 family)